MNENNKYEVIKELIKNDGNKARAALKLGCSKRSIDRYIAGYKAEGKAFFEHGNRNKKPIHCLSSETIADVVGLYSNKYYDANFTHYTELLGEREGIFLSESAVRSILLNADIISPMATRRVRRAFNKRLKEKMESTTNKKEADALLTKIIDAEDAHPRRPRSSHFGEMIQMDASFHIWFGDEKYTLHLAIDDATGMVVGGYFDKQETLNGYYNVLKQILTNYGIPYMFYTDRRTVFEYRKKGDPDTKDDSFTQFSYACSQLGIQIETTSIPQAKGRIERLNGTMQSRLPVDLRLEGVTTVEQANEYLPQYIAKHNAKFALNNNIKSVFETQPSAERIDMILAVVTDRKVDNGHSIRFDNSYYRTVNKEGLPIYFYKGTKGLVIRTFSGELFFSTDDGIFALEEIPLHERTSKNFNFKPTTVKPKKRVIPKQNHPWRLDNFIAFAKKQAHRAVLG
ncbi:MAG: ISNCY family transposase [Chitinispirillales bacterium]|jgi:transposase|nr:ISNCY family transposase [Chitinispirillales bacterium]